jgi:type IV secretion system protein VirB10
MNLPFRNPGGNPEGPGSAYDARPLVAIRKDDRTAWWFAGGAIVAAVLLFSALEARRQAMQSEPQRAADTALASPDAIPDLVVPAMPADQTPVVASGVWPSPGDASRRVAKPLSPSPQRGPVNQQYQPQSGYGESVYSPPPPPPLTGSSSYAVPPVEPAAATPAGGTTGETKRIMADRLRNPATTVIQGTLINAVMETALDSTSPGQTRAIVTRDVFGFDGKRLLIPRGSRLYGAYEADVAQGQNRAQIRWTRLLRPDGVSVALDSPAADTLGRAGVRAKVDSHFLQRVGNALLGTASTIGSTLVTRNVGNSPVIVAVPGTAQSASQIVPSSSNQITPTLSVRQGSRITVFVQHDLDFSTVEGTP